MAQNLLDRLDESIGMEEHNLGRDISDAAMQRGISPVEMRAQIIKQMLEAEGRTISDEDLALFAMGEITLSDVMGRTPSDTDAWTDQAQAPFQAPSLREIYDSQGKLLDDVLGPNPDSPISGKFPNYQRFKELNRNYNPLVHGIHGISTLLGKGVGEVMEAVDEVRKGRTLSDLDQVQALAAESGRTLSNQDLAIGRTMSDRDFATQKRSQDFQQYLQGILNESGANISDRDRQIIQDFMGSNVDPNTLSDRDRQIIEELFKRKRSQGRTPSESNSDAAILEMLK